MAVAAIPAGAQDAQKPAAKAWTPPKTPWGDPDLEGTWPGNMGVPLQRPKSMGERTALTDEEFTQREAQARKNAAADAEEFAPQDSSSSHLIAGYRVHLCSENSSSVR